MRGDRFRGRLAGVLVAGSVATVVIVAAPAPALAAPRGEWPVYALAESVSDDGRFVAFSSDAPDLVAGDTNGSRDEFVRDMWTGRIRQASVGADGLPGDGGSNGGSLSPDGRFLVFVSWASNLVPGDTNDVPDVFLRDLGTGSTSLVDVAADGGQADGYSRSPQLSAGGRFVVFSSWATNLVPGDTNGRGDVFVRDLHEGSTERVSVGAGGVEGDADSDSKRPMLSADGRFVAFESRASNLVPGDTNGRPDVFVRDRWRGTTERVSVDDAGAGADGFSYSRSISRDGRYVAFDSSASNLPGGTDLSRSNAYVRDLRSGTTRLVSAGAGGGPADDSSFEPSISRDGRYVAFRSYASNLVPGDTNERADVFVRDLRCGTVRRASVGEDGTQSDGSSLAPVLTADGRYVAYSSDAADPATGATGVYLHDMARGSTRRVDLPPRT